MGQRVLIVVSGGVADYVCDPGVDVEIFDRDDHADSPDDEPGVPAHFADLAGPIDVPVDKTRTGAGASDAAVEVDRQREAVQFMEELLDSVETLAGIADAHGSRTLADLMYLQHAILSGGFIDSYPSESAVMQIAAALPSGERWAAHIKTEYLMQPQAQRCN